MYRLRSRQAGRRIQQPKRPSQKKLMLSPYSPCPIWLCALQPQSSKPQREVTLSALLPGFYIKPPQSIYLLQGLHSTLIFHMQLVWANPSCVFLAQSLYACTFLCVCVFVCGIGSESASSRTIVFVSVILSWGFHFYLWGYFQSVSVSYLA